MSEGWKVFWSLFLLILVLIAGIPGAVYRFRHPEQTDTQRLLNFFEAYREFFK
jgi:cytochrome c biogenesis protein ResB